MPSLLSATLSHYRDDLSTWVPLGQLREVRILGEEDVQQTPGQGAQSGCWEAGGTHTQRGVQIEGHYCSAITPYLLEHLWGYSVTEATPGPLTVVTEEKVALTALLEGQRLAGVLRGITGDGELCSITRVVLRATGEEITDSTVAWYAGQTAVGGATAVGRSCW